MDRFGTLEPDVQTTLAAFRATGRLPFEQMGVGAAREIYRAGRHTTQLEPLPVASVSDRDMGRGKPLPVRIYRPGGVSDGGLNPAILFFHGGGWVIGDLDTHDSICRWLAVKSGRTVIAVHYRRAPEHRFPAAVKDSQDAFQQVAAGADMLGIDADDIALAGDSAGGALAAALAYHAIEHGPRIPRAQLLFYPVTDLRGGTESYRRVTDVPITAATMHWFRDLYLPHASDAADWRTSPLLVPAPGLLPPTFITTAGHDPLCDEGVQFAQLLARAGVDVEHRHLPGQIHGYLTLGKLIAEASRSLDAAAAFLKKIESRSERPRGIVDPG